jgi:hypothetical protein
VGAVTVLVDVTGIWAPLLVADVGAKVGNHHSDGRVLNSAVPGVNAVAGGGELVASSAARTAPCRTARIEENLTSSGGVALPLPAEWIGIASAAPAGALLAVPIPGGGRARKAV